MGELQRHAPLGHVGILVVVVMELLLRLIIMVSNQIIIEVVERTQPLMVVLLGQVLGEMLVQVDVVVVLQQ